MSVLGTALGMTMHGGLGAYQSMDFGKKGLAIGGAVGAAGYLAGETVDDGGLAGAVMSGMISGSVQSAFSTVQELYAFHNPQHVSAMSSINTTTSASALAAGVHGTITGPNRKAQFMVNMLSPQNLMTDLTRMGMISGDLSKMGDQLAEAFGIDPETGEKAVKKGNPIGRAFGLVKNHIKDNLAASEAKTPWFSKEAVNFDIDTMNPDANPWNDEPRKIKKSISLTGRESMGERAAMFVEANEHMYDDAFKNLGELRRQAGMSDDGFNVKNSKDYATYLRSMNGGAVDTMQALHKAGYGGKGSPFLKRTIGMAAETYMGSPLWARTVDKQMTSGVISNTEEWTDADGKTQRRMQANADGKIHFKGGGRFGRVAAIAGDVLMGGAINASINVALFAAASPFRNGANSAIET